MPYDVGAGCVHAGWGPRGGHTGRRPGPRWGRYIGAGRPGRRCSLGWLQRLGLYLLEVLGCAETLGSVFCVCGYRILKLGPCVIVGDVIL